MSILQVLFVLGVFLLTSLPSSVEVAAFAAPRMPHASPSIMPSSSSGFSTVVGAPVWNPSRSSSSVYSSSLASSTDSAKGNDEEPEISLAKAIRTKIRKATGLSFTALRKTLRQITGFSWTALRATLRAATGISLTAIWLSTTAVTGLWIRKSMSVVLSLFPAWFRYFLQPFLILYYAPLVFLRSMTSPAARGTSQYWTRVEKAVEKAETELYEPIDDEKDSSDKKEDTSS
eukprot:CAMPEP_0119570232 /NCGR_PEP_ID=MMETSP1352-20130426/43510_1 /TAXON_ID=265584 /ORGANISM="Stauroneis constricta, Strain CCMP1120" /LENGTH=230 /DNA_ID=CAMNT_0007619899 /DNA_START=64 /DNA_END=756 /DNA_ORIENTATION=+